MEWGRGEASFTSLFSVFVVINGILWLIIIRHRFPTYLRVAPTYFAEPLYVIYHFVTCILPLKTYYKNSLQQVAEYHGWWIHNEEAENTSQGHKRLIFHTRFPLISWGEYCNLSWKHTLPMRLTNLWLTTFIQLLRPCTHLSSFICQKQWKSSFWFWRKHFRYA